MEFPYNISLIKEYQGLDIKVIQVIQRIPRNTNISDWKISSITKNRLFIDVIYEKYAEISALDVINII